MAEKNTPARKGRSSAPAKRADDTPARDDALSGDLTYTDEYLLAHPRKRKELLQAPDGTPGKEVALRVEAAAPLIRAATKEVKVLDQLQGKAVHHLQTLADHIVRLRMVYRDAKGQPDMRGSSGEYRSAVKKIYEDAGIPADSASNLQANVRYHVNKRVREVLNGPDFANGDTAKYAQLCEYYGLNPKHMGERIRDKRRQEVLPALSIAPDAPGEQAWERTVEHARQALALPAKTTPPEELEPETRQSLREQLEAVLEQVTSLLERLEDADRQMTAKEVKEIEAAADGAAKAALPSTD